MANMATIRCTESQLKEINKLGKGWIDKVFAYLAGHIQEYPLYFYGEDAHEFGEFPFDCRKSIWIGNKKRETFWNIVLKGYNKSMVVRDVISKLSVMEMD